MVPLALVTTTPSNSPCFTISIAFSFDTHTLARDWVPIGCDVASTPRTKNHRESTGTTKRHPHPITHLFIGWSPIIHLFHFICPQLCVSILASFNKVAPWVGESERINVPHYYMWVHHWFAKEECQGRIMNIFLKNTAVYERMNSTQEWVATHVAKGVDFLTQAGCVTTLCPTMQSWLARNPAPDDSHASFQSLRPNTDLRVRERGHRP